MRRLLTGALLLLIGAAPLGAQQDAPADGPRRRSVALALGVVGPATWLEMFEGAGITMRTDVGIRAGVEATFPGFRLADVALVARVARAAPAAKDRELAGDPGAVTTLELLGGVDWLLGGRGRVRAAAGAALVQGPDDVDPWASDDALAPAADLSFSWRATRGGDWWVAVGANALHYSGVATANPVPGSAGTVLRPWLEVRRAF